MRSSRRSVYRKLRPRVAAVRHQPCDNCCTVVVRGSAVHNLESTTDYGSEASDPDLRLYDINLATTAGLL